MKTGGRRIERAGPGKRAVDVRAEAPALPSANGTPGNPAEEYIARERKYASKLEDAKQAMLRMSQNAADRERLLAERVHDVQQVALGMSQAAAERTRRLSDAMNALRVDLTQQVQELLGRTSELRDNLAGQEREALRHLQTIDAMTQREGAREKQLAEARRRLADVIRLCSEIHRSPLDLCRFESASEGGDSIAGPSTGAGGLKQLLTLRGETLVVGAFRSLLHRDPDPSGLDHFLSELGRGASAVEIVWRIRYSPEGRRIAADTSDIRFALMREQAYRAPLVGKLLRAIGDACGLIGAQRKRRAFEHTVARRLEEANRVNRELQHQLLGIAQKITLLEETMSARAPDQGATE